MFKKLETIQSDLRNQLKILLVDNASPEFIVKILSEYIFNLLTEKAIVDAIKSLTLENRRKIFNHFCHKCYIECDKTYCEICE